MSRSSAPCRGRLWTVDEAAFDVLILGAGPAGCATALALRARGVERILIADRAPPASFIPGESATPDVGPLLATLGLDGDLGRIGARPYHGNLTAWGGPPALSLFGRRGTGWHLDRAAFELWLRQEAASRGVVLACPARLRALDATSGGWDATVEGFGGVRARVVVDAAGRRAPLATRLGARRRRLDALVALAVRAPCAPRGADGYSLVESFASGWWYAARVPGGDAVVMLMTDRDIAQSYRDAGSFAQAWRDTAVIGRRIEVPEAAITPRVFAAHGGFLEPAAGTGWIAVGDALMSLDPLTSSGLSGALNDAVAAAGAIVEMLNGNDSAAAYAQRANSALQRYLAGHATYYSLERRWPTQSFWARRLSPFDKLRVRGGDSRQTASVPHPELVEG
jgi:flavin-dependent dehydrogenase